MSRSVHVDVGSEDRSSFAEGDGAGGHAAGARDGGGEGDGLTGGRGIGRGSQARGSSALSDPQDAVAYLEGARADPIAVAGAGGDGAVGIRRSGSGCDAGEVAIAA